MKTLHFTFGGSLCMQRLDGEEIEVEIGPDKYRAHYDTNYRGQIVRIQFEREESRPGKPELWVPAPDVPYAVVRAIEHQIEDEYIAEQRRIVEHYDAEIA